MLIHVWINYDEFVGIIFQFTLDYLDGGDVHHDQCNKIKLNYGFVFAFALD